jgi:hypothetical protein
MQLISRSLSNFGVESSDTGAISPVLFVADTSEQDLWTAGGTLSRSITCPSRSPWRAESQPSENALRFRFLAFHNYPASDRHAALLHCCLIYPLTRSASSAVGQCMCLTRHPCRCHVALRTPLPVH